MVRPSSGVRKVSGSQEPPEQISKPKIVEAALKPVPFSQPQIKIKTKPAGVLEPKVKPQELKIGDRGLASSILEATL